MTLLDTSVWVAVFQNRNALRLTEVVELDDVVTCLPVVQEVLQGFREERAFRIALDALTALPIVESPLHDSLFLDAVDLYRSARRHGLTVRSSTDCLIAACALRNDLEVLHRDRDYALLAEVAPLRVRAV